MRLLYRNKRQIYYAQYIGETKQYDEIGKYTGQVVETFAEPAAITVSVSPVSDKERINPYGLSSLYELKIATTDTNCPINGKSKIWVYANPATDEADYAVVNIETSQNFKVYFLKSTAR